MKVRATGVGSAGKTNFRVSAGILILVASIGGVNIPADADPFSDAQEALCQAVLVPATIERTCWKAQHDGELSIGDQPAALAVDPLGGRLVVAGRVGTGAYTHDFATVAYDTASGAKLWEARRHWDGESAVPIDVALAPDGSRAFVVGRTGPGQDIATVAYDSASGAEVWNAVWDDAGSVDEAKAVAVDPLGRRVYVTGARYDGEDWDYVTIAYAAASGARLWTATYDGTTGSSDNPAGIGVSPNGRAVYVAGTSYGELPAGWSERDFATVAYDSETGETLWVRRYANPAILAAEDSVGGLAVGATAIVVAGRSTTASGADFVTVAYSPTDGAPLWVARHTGPLADSGARTVALAGPIAVVTGYSSTNSGPGEARFLTVAYDLATGVERWAAVYAGPTPGGHFPRALAASPDASRVYVSGSSDGQGTFQDYATIAYDAAAGTEIWVARFNGGEGQREQVWDAAADPRGGRLYVTGSTSLEYTSIPGYSVLNHDWVTVSYATATGVLDDV